MTLLEATKAGTSSLDDNLDEDGALASSSSRQLAIMLMSGTEQRSVLTAPSHK